MRNQRDARSAKFNRSPRKVTRSMLRVKLGLSGAAVLVEKTEEEGRLVLGGYFNVSVVVSVVLSG